MGQQESKQKIQQITLSLQRIRKDVRNGKITGNDVERIQGILQKYSTEVESNRNAKIKRSDIYTVEQLIEITSKELDSLKEEVSLDQAAIHTNSFTRTASKNHSKRKSVKSVADAVEAIRDQIRKGQVQNYEQIQADLVAYSQELSAKKGKKQEVEKTQKLISSVTAELFKKQQQDTPDNVSLRSSTNSLSRRSEKRVSIKEDKQERRSSLREQDKRRESPKIANKNAASTLGDIQAKLEALKNDINVAESSKDKSRLRFLSKSIQTLMTDLQLINVKNEILNEERKELLEKNLQHAYQQIEKIKRQISTESNLNYLVELEKKQKREKYMQELAEMEKVLMTVSTTLNNQNYQAEKQNFVTYKAKLDSMEDMDQELVLKKSELSDTMLNLENAITKLEMEDRLNQAEYRHCQYKIDLKKFTDTPESETYKKHRQYLAQLRDYVSKILEVSQKVDEKKKYVVYNIDNNIAALDKKAKENEENEKEDGIILRRITSPNSTSRSLADNLLLACNEVPTKCSLQEAKDILPILTQAKLIIDQKLNLLQNLGQKEEPDAVLVTVIEKQTQPVLINFTMTDEGSEEEIQELPAKVGSTQSIKELPPKVGSTHSIKELPPKVGSTPSIKELPPKVGSIQSLKELPPKAGSTQSLKELPPPKVEVGSSSQTHLDNIQKEVEALQIHIENSRYTKETQLYKDVKSKLETYRNQLTTWARENPDGRLGDNLLKYIDNVLLLLENNMSSRKSTTEDLLVDIMSISTRVSDLGSKILGFNNSQQDYNSIKNSLREHRQYLQNLKISPNRSNLYKSRDEILQQIDRYLSTLDDVKKNGTNSGSEEEKRFNQDLRKLKDKVSRYSGTYKNVLYKTIENDLDRHLSSVDKVFKDSNVALKVKREIENSKMILEQKSNKDQHEVKRDVRDPGGKELTEIRQNIESVKKELAQIRPLTKEELDQLDARLTLSILALDNIKDDHYNREKERLYQDIHYYFAQIQELKLVSRPHSVLVEDLQQQQLDEEKLAAKTIAQIEKELEEIKPDIMAFVGTETSPKFLQLDEILVRGTLKLDELNLDMASKLYPLKVKLMREIHKYSDILDERINETEEIEKLENEVKVMLIKIDSFNGYFGDSEYTFLDEQIIRLKVSLGKLHVNRELIGRRDACIKEIDTCMKKLNEAAKPRTDAFAGTLV